MRAKENHIKAAQIEQKGKGAVVLRIAFDGDRIPYRAFFFKTLESFLKSYANLFGQKGGETASEYEKRWGWFILLSNITNNDFTKWDTVLDWNIVRLLNTISFIKDKQEHEQELHNQASGKRVY